MNPEQLTTNSFDSDGLNITWYETGNPDGIPVLCIHGFASTARVNWVFTGWTSTLSAAGYRVIAIDNRGHGKSDKPHDPEAYYPHKMAADAARLLDHLSIESAHVIGYSMGARIVAYLAIARPDLMRSAVFGGLGLGMVEGVGDWDPIAEALLAPSIDNVTHERGRMFRAFAEQTRSDLVALAACIRASRTLVKPEQLALMTMPALVAVGTRDDIAGSASGLADLLPDGMALDLENRDHMLAVGDKVFKKSVLEFFATADAR